MTTLHKQPFSLLLLIIVATLTPVAPVPLNFNEPPPPTTPPRAEGGVVVRDRQGCRYQGGVYASGDRIGTAERCLTCACKGSVVVCKLRVCPEVPDVPPPGCIVLHKAHDCCPQLICNGPPDNFLRKLSRDQTLPGGRREEEEFSSRALVSSQTEEGGCVQDGTVYAEGSAMRSSTLCQHCFCIRGRSTCSEPACLIPLPGCVPKFRSYACCPTNYDCSESRNSSVVKSGSLEAGASLAETQVGGYLKGCRVGGVWVAEGEPVLPLHLANTSSVCQTCFCMGGVVTCSALECAKNIDNCTPVIQDGHCCPDRYDCVSSVTEHPEEVTSNDLSPNEAAVTEEEVFVAPTPDDDLVETSTLAAETTFVPEESAQESATAGRAMTSSPGGGGWSQVGGFKMLGGRGKKEGRRDDWAFYSSSSEEDAKSSSSAGDENSSSRLFEDAVSDKSSSDSEESADTPSVSTTPATFTGEMTDVVTLILHDDLLEESRDTNPPPTATSPVPTSTASLPTTTLSEEAPPTFTSTSTTSHSLEFIPFGVEDALLLSPPQNNSTATLHYEVHPPSPPPAELHGGRDEVPPPEGFLSLLMRPLKLQDPPPPTEGGVPVPLLVEEPAPLLPGGSLYSHGYYGVPTDPLSQEETSLVITQAELSPPSPPPPPTPSPSRTYSKFSIHDSSFRHPPTGGFVPVTERRAPPPPAETDSPWRPGPLTVSSPLSSVVVSSRAKGGAGKKASKIVMAKPMRRKGGSGNVEFHPVVAFPFPLGDSGGGLVGGLKLSGCNIYGKTVRVGSVIPQLSSICVQCLCSEMGVQCSELQC